MLQKIPSISGISNAGHAVGILSSMFPYIDFDTIHFNSNYAFEASFRSIRIYLFDQPFLYIRFNISKSNNCTLPYRLNELIWKKVKLITIIGSISLHKKVKVIYSIGLCVEGKPNKYKYGTERGGSIFVCVGWPIANGIYTPLPCYKAEQFVQIARQNWWSRVQIKLHLSQVTSSLRCPGCGA